MRNVFIVPTDKQSRLVRIYNDAERKNFTLKLDAEVNDSFKEYVNIYIVNDEKIKENTQTFQEGFNGDWFFNTLYKFIARTGDTTRFDFKVILTTDPQLIADGVQAIDYTFLEWFVKNPTCEFVEVEKEWEGNGTMFGFRMGDASPDGTYVYKIIIPNEEPNLHGYICPQTKKQCDDECCVSAEDCHIEAWKSTISDSKEEQTVQVIQTKEDADIFYKEMENPSPPNEKLKKAFKKQESLEEAIDRISKEDGYDIEGGKVADFVDGMVKGAKWQQEQNKSLYSEEEARIIWKAGQEYWKTSGASITFEELIEQVKKK